MKLSVLLAALTLSAGALAQQPATPPSSSAPGVTPPSATAPGLTSPTPGSKPPAAAWPTFETLDTNADSRISPTEAAASVSVSNRFSALDKNNKGYLTREEYQAAARAGERERTGSDTN